MGKFGPALWRSAPKDSEVFALAPQPKPPARSTPPTRPVSSNRIPPPPPPPVTPRELSHHYILNLRPAAVALVAPIALLLMLVFWFFPWAGSYPGGEGIYTQSGLQMAWRSHSTDAVGEKVLRADRNLDDSMPWNGLMVLYILVALAALALVLAPMAGPSVRMRLPPMLEAYWPWHTLIALGLATGSGLAMLLPIARAAWDSELRRQSPLPFRPRSRR